MIMCASVHSGAFGDQNQTSDALELEVLQATVWVLGTEPGSSGRASAFDS